MIRKLIPTIWLSVMAFVSTTVHAESFRLFYSHDGMGELEPCGCRANPMGGVIRLKNALKKQATTSPSIYVDTGNSYFESREVAGSLREPIRIQSEKLAEAHRELGLKLYVPGDKDFALGLDHFKKLVKISKITPLSLNLEERDEKTKSHFFQQEFVTKSGDTSYRFVGLHGTDLILPEELVVKNPTEALKKYLDDKPLQTNEKLIVLSELTLEKDRTLAEMFTKISLIIGSRDQAFTQTPITVGSTLIVQTSYRNQYLGIVNFSDESAPVAELMGLDESLESSPDKKLVQIIANWKKSTRKFSSISTPAAQNSSKQFQTFPSCVSCHDGIFKFWMGTPHSQALTPLLAKDQFSQPQCLTCHTLKPDRGALVLENGKKLGWTEHASFMKDLAQFTRTGTPAPKPQLEQVKQAWGAVQCENCHGPAGNHPFEGQMKKIVPETTCLKCHTEERAPSWYEGKRLKPGIVDLKKKLIQCPAG